MSQPHQLNQTTLLSHGKAPILSSADAPVPNDDTQGLSTRTSLDGTENDTVSAIVPTGHLVDPTLSNDTPEDTSASTPWTGASWPRSRPSAGLVDRTEKVSHRYDPTSSKRRNVSPLHTALSTRRAISPPLDATPLAPTTGIEEVVEKQDMSIEMLEQLAQQERRDIHSSYNQDLSTPMDVETDVNAHGNQFSSAEDDDEMFDDDEDESTVQEADAGQEDRQPPYEGVEQQDGQMEPTPAHQQHELSTADTQLAQLLRDLEVTRGEVLTLQQSNNELILLRDEKAGRIQELDALIRNLEQEHSSLQTEAAEYTQREATQQTMLQQQTDALAACRLAAEQHQRNTAQLQQEIARLKGALEQKEKDRSGVGEALQQLKIEQDRTKYLESRVKLMQSHQETLEKLSGKKSEKVEGLQQTIRSLEHNLSTLKSENQRLQNYLNSLQTPSTARSVHFVDSPSTSTKQPASGPASSQSVKPGASNVMDIDQPTSPSASSSTAPASAPAMTGTPVQPAPTPSTSGVAVQPAPTPSTSGAAVQPAPTPSSGAPVQPASTPSSGAAVDQSAPSTPSTPIPPTPVTPASQTGQSYRHPGLLSNPRSHMFTPGRTRNPSTPQTPVPLRTTGSLRYNNQGTRLFQFPVGGSADEQGDLIAGLMDGMVDRVIQALEKKFEKRPEASSSESTS